jgi:putative transposase
MPIDRKRDFKSEIILPREQVDPRIQEDLAVLHLAGISTRTIEMISKRIFGEDLSKNNIKVGLKKIEPRAKEFLNRRLDEKKYWALFVDGTNFRMRRSGTVSKEPTLVVLAVDGSNCLSIIGAEPGYKDDKNCWGSMFESLKRRGLNANSIQIGIMDGLPGLEEVFKENFPKSQSARCWVHAMKNSYAKVSEKLLAAFQKELKKVMYSTSEQSARESFKKLKEIYGSSCERAVRVIEKDLDSLLVHYQFDQSLWRALKTTNAIERVNKEFKRRTKSMEQIGENTLQILLAFTALRLEMNWRSVPINSSILGNLKNNKNNYLEQTIGVLLN